MSAVSDRMLLETVETCDNYRQVADRLGIAYQTVKNRMCKIGKQRTQVVNDKAEKMIVDSLQDGKTPNKRFVITSAQNATPVFRPFLQALRGYCTENNAELVVLPIRYKNPTSQWTDNQDGFEWWDRKIVDCLLTQRVDMPCGVTVMGDIKIQPTATKPLSGFDSFTDGNSAIFGHPKLQFKTVPTPKHSIPKILTTSMSVTVKNYTDSKAGKKGENFHKFGATVLDVDNENKVFHIRQVIAEADGSFIDLDKRYSKKGVSEAPRAMALITGDTHAIFADDDVIKATYLNEDSIVKRLKPEYLVWHDALDQYARNHHHRGDFFTNYAKHHSGFHNIRRELDITFDLIDRCTPEDVTNIIARSNHDEALERYLQEANFKEDPENAEFYLETMLELVRGMRIVEGRPQKRDPFEYWGSRLLKCYDRTKFLKRDESFLIGDTNVSYHGDQGPNGSRGSANAFTKIGGDLVIAHSHSPCIEENVWQVGLSAIMDMGYNKGPSSWLNTHCIKYANGKKSLISIVKGAWN